MESSDEDSELTLDLNGLGRQFVDAEDSQVEITQFIIDRSPDNNFSSNFMIENEFLDSSILSTLIERVRTITNNNYGNGLDVNNLIVCTLTGTFIFKNKVTLGNGLDYEARNLGDYLLVSEDHRDPSTGYVFSSEDISLIKESVSDFKNRTFSVKESLPKSPMTSVITYYEDRVKILQHYLLTSCELTNISSETFDDDIDKIWRDLQISLCGLIKYNPMSAFNSSDALFNALETALQRAEVPNDYFYEPSVLIPTANSVISLCKLVTSGIVKSSTNEMISNIMACFPQRPVFY